VLDGYTQVPVNADIFDHVSIDTVVHEITAPSPQSSSIESAFFSQDALHVTVVLHHALVNDLVVISGFEHNSQSSKLCTASSHRSPSIILSSGFLSFR
jgi:hypothetical protein